MKVWVVTMSDFSGMCEVCVVFSSKEKADEELAKRRWYPGSYGIVEKEVDVW